MIQVDEATWSLTCEALRRWREDYDRILGAACDENGVRMYANSTERALVEASTAVLGQRKDAKPTPGSKTTNFYDNGDNHGRVVSEFRARRNVQAAAFMEYDLNGEQANRDDPGYLRVDPTSLQEVEDGKLLFRFVNAPPQAPTNYHQAVDFFRRHAGIAVLRNPPTAEDVRYAAKRACDRGYVMQANHAALIVAHHFGIRAEDVNPFGEHGQVPWVDVLPFLQQQPASIGV